MGLSENILVLVVIVILPLIPACILYKWLPPEKTIAKGPFRGLTLQLTGSFAGYFVVLLFISGFFLVFSSQKDKYDEWIVRGVLQLEQGESDLTDVDDAFVTVIPPARPVRPNGIFTIKIPIQKGKKINVPSLLIKKDGYKFANVYLYKDFRKVEGIPFYEIEYKPGTPNLIEILTPIKLKKMRKKIKYSEKNAIDGIPTKEE